MKLIDPPFKLCEEVLDTIVHFTSNTIEVEDKKIFTTINKTHSYVKKAIDYLIQIEIIQVAKNKISLSPKENSNNKNFIPIASIKKGITNFKPFKEYLRLLQKGKTQKSALQLVKATFDIVNDNERIKEIFEKKIQYLENDIPLVPEVKNKVTNIPTENNFFWIDENGHLVYDEKAHTDKIINDLETKRYKNPAFIDQSRIDVIKKIQNPHFDLSKLVKLCEEINDSYRLGNYLSVGVLVRAMLDHIPPIFTKKSFTEVANNHGTRSFKDVMNSLEGFTRKIADGILHTQIRKKESLPNATTVDCRSGLDILLGEIINELS